ncbi:signal peptidase I [Spirochaeta africana]|uniref:Signal peptidase I n=1 Tax=Spirochaeta africana (strain ATCC 700263 / DSM 8902 / Z-7692) TaxID=889378 RepID=H9UJC2_SPIAZ|nr:signal peptidase I [Spirochaeta africana]AFG37615.1 signal peptidase I [Spirochaeta africana DSM 8902]
MKNAAQLLVQKTEYLLTLRKQRKQRIKDRHARKHPVRDWIEAFLQAALIVLVINQYLVQAYQIPSASMRPTLIEGDRIFVNKMIYGPQLLPGFFKLPGFFSPVRGEVVILENPTQHPRGTMFSLVHRILHMLTLSMVDIDRDEMGNPRASLLIKRAIGIGEDRIRSVDGDIYIRPAGAARWHADEELIFGSADASPIQRLVPPEAYADMRRFAAIISRSEAGIPLSEADRSFATSFAQQYPPDINTRDQLRIEERSAMNPADPRISAQRKRTDLGWYLPPGGMLTLGDNRDNSHDGRNYGFVYEDDILGRALFIYWPARRWGGIQ